MTMFRKFNTEFHYVSEYNSYLSKFREELLQLQERREEVEKLVEQARREFKDPRKEVLEWVERVENMEKECMQVNESIITGKKRGLQNLSSRRKISKQLLKLTIDICELREEGSFTEIANQLPPQVENFPSRKLIIKQVMEALEDDNIRSIGVYGTGGIGKTTLVTRIHNELCANGYFKKVIMVTVSKDPHMKMLQDRIAEGLDMKLEGQDIATRADKLCERLKSEESVVIILDHVWNEIEVGEIGLQHSIEHMPCKFIVTTRNASVCSGMKVQKVIKMDILSEDESWALFETESGHFVAEQPDLEPIARDIVSRCKGSPLAISILGSTLRGEEDMLIWAYALQAFEDPDTIRSENITPEVIKSVRWLYNCLPDPRVQLCFLCCTSYPKDYNIRLPDLMVYGIRQGFLTTTTTLEDALDELFCYVQILKDCCLLSEGDDESSVKMQDTVMDIATLIASYGEIRLY